MNQRSPPQRRPYEPPRIQTFEDKGLFHAPSSLCDWAYWRFALLRHPRSLHLRRLSRLHDNYRPILAPH